MDGWQTESNEAEQIRIEQPRRFQERVEAAQLCAGKLHLTIPTLVDGMDNAAYEAYSAWPERIYIIDQKGIVHYRGGPGPYGFSPVEARDSLIELL